jgi:hypothetical protein
VKLSHRTKVLGAVIGTCAVVAVIAALLTRADTSRAQGRTNNLFNPSPAGSHYELVRDETHLQQVESKMTPLAARFNAEKGATTCETAYNGYRAFLDADTTKHNSTFVLPARDVFLARCNSLSEQEQLCLLASYEATHRDVCLPLYRGITPKVFEQPPDSPQH